MKSFCLFLWVYGCLNVQAQAIGVFAGRNLMPADYLAVQYFHPSNVPLQLAAKVFKESTSHNSLRFVSYGAVLSIHYSSFQEFSDPAVLHYRLGLGITAQVEREPWIVTTNMHWRTPGFGFAGEAAADWALSTAFSFSFFIQQRWLVNHGDRVFVLGLGLIYSLRNDH